jgi:hypothetical protein
LPDTGEALQFSALAGIAQDDAINVTKATVLMTGGLVEKNECPNISVPTVISRVDDRIFARGQMEKTVRGITFQAFQYGLATHISFEWSALWRFD